MKLGLGYKQGKMPLKASIISLMLLFAVFCCCAFSPTALAEEPLPPEQIILTWTVDPTTSQTITWLMPNDSLAQVQYLSADEYSGNFNSAQTMESVGTVFDSVYYRYTVNLTGLAPDTKYIYRVGGEAAWSEPLSFTTATDTDNFTFLYMGDVQSGYAEWGNMLDSLYQDYPEIKFSLLGGDLTDNGNDVNEWGQFLDAATGVFSRMPMMPTLGNHDGYIYLKFFALPDNGPASLQQEFYSFDYGNAHFVVLDSGNNTNETAKQWLREDLQNTTKKWKFAVFHHPAYPAFNDGKSIAESIRENWIPILEDNGVDMVFVGHQHLYMRTHPICWGEVQNDPKTYGIVYVMGNAGSKTYTGGEGFSYIAREETGSNYQIIDIDGDVLTLTAKKANGELIESYTIHKSIPITLTTPGPGKEFLPGEQVTIKGTAEETFTSVEVKVAGPEGEIVYGPVDVDIADGIFETSFMLDSSSKIGTYTIVLVEKSLPNVFTSTFLVKPEGSGEIPTENIILTITGNGVTTEVEFTLSQLQAMEQYQQKYSTINTWPTKKFYLTEGVWLNELLQKAGIKDDARLITFKAKDGFTKTLTREQLDAPRYYYPGLKENHEYFGYIPGSTEGAKKVDMILALKSVEGSDPDYMSGREAPLLVMGQSWITEQTNELFVKHLKTITVSTEIPGKWENPVADKESGIVPAGTKVTLSTSDMDGANIHFTTDGTNPTIESPIYNWVKKRWWKDRSDELAEINKPIELTRDTTIKAITIGPGREDSDIVTFNYKVPLESAPDLKSDITNNTVGQVIYLTFTDNPAWREAIREISIDGLVLEVGQYSTDTSGEIAIKGDVFSAAGEYTIVIKALGYTDASITQEMISSVTLIIPAKDQAFTRGEQVVIKGTAEDTVTSLQVKVTDPKGQVVYGSTNVLVSDGKFETSFTLSSDAEVGKYTIILNGVGLPDIITGAFMVKSGTVIVPPPDEDVLLTITGSGVGKEVKLTLKELQEMNQYQQVYSAINTWPTKKWYVGKGVKLRDLLDLAGMKGNYGLIKFTANDGFTITLTAKELLYDSRYYFPNFMNNTEGHIPGSSTGGLAVEPIVALISAEGTNSPGYMNDLNTPLLMLGQRAVTEQNGQLFVKNLSKIEVLATSPSQWDTPKADPVSGEVAVGTLIKLSNNNMDDDKIHYTTDGSTPTINSPIYNWIASRWWSSRADVLEINHPIEIKEDTTIKAITIGPGKNDSQVATFTYKVKPVITIIIEEILPNKDNTISLGDDVSLKIPANGLKETGAVKIEINRVAIPPTVSDGLRLVGSVYEFSVDGKSSYSFAKNVTLRIRINPDEIGEDEVLAIHYYDEDSGAWINIGGIVDGDTITVEIDHFTKFAVMAIAKAKVEEPEEKNDVNLTDIAGHWAQKNIERLVASSVVSGYPDGTFKPNNTITRAEFVTILVKAFELDKQGDKAFADTASHWAKNYIACAVASGIVTGYNTDTFGPDDLVTREQMAVMISKAAELKPSVETEELQFIDSDSISDWARGAIAAVSRNDIMKGYPDNTIQPKGNATRAEAVTVIVNALNKLAVVGKTAS